MIINFDSLIKSFDILSSKPLMKINGSPRFTTNFGIALSFICIFTILGLSLFIIIDVISRNNFTMIYNLDSRELSKVKVNETQTALLLLDSVGNELQEYDRYFNFLVKFWNITVPDRTKFANSTKQNLLPIHNIMDLPLKNCSKMNYKKFNSFYVDLAKTYDTVLCIDFSSLNETLFGTYGGVHGYSTLNIYFRKCVNSTPNNKTNCFSEDVINAKLSQAYINILTVENHIDSKNFTNPISEFSKNDMLPISSTIFKNYFKDYNKIIFSSDNGFIFQNTQSFEAYRTDQIMESVDLRGKNTLFAGTFSQITYRFSGKTEYFYRSYQKVPATFAYISGLLQAIILGGKIFIYLFSKNSMLNFLYLHTFDPDNFEEEMQTKKEFIKINDFHKLLKWNQNIPLKDYNYKMYFENKIDDYEKNMNNFNVKVLQVKNQSKIKNKIDINDMNIEKKAEENRKEEPFYKIKDLNKRFEDEVNNISSENKAISNAQNLNINTVSALNLINNKKTRNFEEAPNMNPNLVKKMKNSQLFETEKNGLAKNYEINSSNIKDISEANIINRAELIRYNYYINLK